MSLSKALASAAVACVAIVLHGCGDSSNSTTPAPTPDPASSSDKTTATTTAVPLMGQICQDGEDECVTQLNALYGGFDEGNDASPLGVPMRGRSSFTDNGTWYFCNGQCHNGQPDCYTAAGLINHKVMITEDGKIPNLLNSQSKENAFFARYPVLIVLQPETVLKFLTKCAWQFDGSAFNRQNGGCGMGGPADCKDPGSGFQDKCSDDESSWADDSCPSTMKAYCGNASVEFGNNCFWKGPAFRSPVFPDAQPDFDFSDFPSQDELRRMMMNRVSDNHQDGSTEDGLPLLEYWNELTLDGRIIKHFEETTGLGSVIAAVAFVRGNGADIDAESQKQAQMFVDHFKSQQVEMPLLVLDTAAAPGEGPFKSLAASLVV